MQKHNYIRILLFFLLRSFQVGVVIPSSIVGASLLFATLVGQSPIQKTVIAIHHWAETSVRPAPPGTVLVAECKTLSSKEIKPLVICDSTDEEVVPINEAALRASKQLTPIYLILVIVSFGGLLSVRPGREFFGIHENWRVLGSYALAAHLSQINGKRTGPDTLDPNWTWFLLWNNNPLVCQEGNGPMSWKWEPPLPGDQLKTKLNALGLLEGSPEWDDLMHLKPIYFNGRWMKISGAGRRSIA